MEHHEFYERAVKPGFGDFMHFQLEREAEDDLAFSMEAIEDLAEEMKNFLLARIYARWKLTGKAPRQLLAKLDLKWQSYPQDVLDLGLPWWAAVDPGVDGQTRHDVSAWRPPKEES